MKVDAPIKKKVSERAKKKAITEAIQKLQQLSGITVTRKATCQGVFPKPLHIFYVAKSVKTGVEIRYEIQLPLEKEIGQENVMREIIKIFSKHANKVN